jgi:hypothetical protein
MITELHRSARSFKSELGSGSRVVRSDLSSTTLVLGTAPRSIFMGTFPRAKPLSWRLFFFLTKRNREEIEAYLQDGVLSKAGLAFSRDTKKKIYIQHKMNEDGDLLVSLFEKQGYFYLCGPTWPVPDVYEALVEAFVRKGKTVEDAKEHIEQLKEDERYVLEVSARFSFFCRHCLSLLFAETRELLQVY